MYFHRTERCPTCKMMGSYSEEAVKKGFPDQLKQGTVEFKFIDYEKKENAALAKAYKVKGPALIVARIEANKVKQYKDLKEIWSKVREKPKFVAYVQENVNSYIE
jgi:thiol-disulfide isomerase/thioredoxin